MTVSNTTAKLQYAGDGTTRTFGITFPLLSADHLRVVVTDASGTETEITNNYTLSDDLDSITYPTEASGLDPLASGYKITLIRQTPLTQQIDLHSGGVLDAEQLESGYDKLTLLVQELKTQLDRCIKYAVSNNSPQAAEQFLTDITTAATNAANSATAASASASTASTKASNAAASETAAAGYAISAYNYSQAANGYVGDAQTHAQSAATYATQAEGYKESAETASETAVAAQSVVEGYKDDAAGYASAAGESASAAATSASAASDAKDLAVAAKVAAAGSADTAASAATNAQSAAATCATADTKISNHNESTTAHADMRQEIAGKQAALPDGATGLFLRKTADGVDWAQPSGGGGGGGSVDWGGIGGTLSNQTDLKNVLDGKAAASHTHTKSEITDFPTIPAKVSDLQNDSGFITSSDLPTVPTKLSDLTDDLGSSPTHTHSQYLESVSWSDVSSKPSSFTPSSHTHTKSEITDFPTIPSKTSQLTNDSGFITDIAVATTSAAGKVKPDGTTITVAADGTISAAGGSGITATYDSTNKILTLE